MEGILYHGSNNSNLDELKPHRSTHKKECIYATPSKAVALLFIGKGNGDLDTMISSVDGKPQLLERREGIFEELYNRDGYLYEIDASTFEHYDYLWSLEVISFEKAIKPLKKIYIPNVWEAIEEEEKLGNLTIYHYPDRPKSVPSDNSDLIEKYIRFEKSGLVGAVGDLLRIYPEFAEEVSKSYPEFFEQERKKEK